MNDKKLTFTVHSGNHHDRAGELGTTEEDLDTGEVDIADRPDYAPDMHGYIARSLLFARVVGIVLYVAALFGLGLFCGWALWGQP